MNQLFTTISRSGAMVIFTSLILLFIFIFFKRFGFAKEFGNFILFISIFMISLQILKAKSKDGKKYLFEKFLLLEWIVVIFSVILIFRSIFSIGPVVWGDAPYFYQERFKDFTLEPLVWESRGRLGVVNDLYFIYPLMFIYNLLGALFNLSNDLIIRLVFYFPAIFFSCLSPLLFTKYFGFSPLTRIFSVLLYSLNTYIILLIDGGQVGVALAYGIFPFALVNLHKLFKKQSFSQFFVSLVSLMLLVIADVRFAIIAALSFFIWIILEDRASFLRNGLKSLKVFGLLFLAITLLCSYWLIPAFFIIPTTGAGARSSLELISVLNPLFLFSPHWPLNMFGKVSPPEWYFIGIPLLIFSNLFFRRDRQILVLILNFLLFVFLAKGNTGFFGSLYGGLIDHIPFGGAFRDPTKFFAPLMLYGGILIGMAVENLTQIIKKQLFGKAVVYLSLGYLIFLLYPALFGNMYGVLAGRQIPQDLQTIAEKISDETSFLRTAWFPERYPLAFSTEKKPALDAKTLVDLRPFASLNTGDSDKFNFLHNNQFLQWLDIFGIKYLIFSGDTRQVLPDKENEQDWDKLLKLVDSVEGLDKVDWRTNMAIYQTQRNKPRFFTVDKVFAVVGSDDIYQKLLEKDKNFSIGNQGFIFFEDGKFDPRSLQQFLDDSIVLIFNQKDKEDLQLSFLSEFFIPPIKALKSQWALRPTKEYLKWKFELLVNKVPTGEFDYGQGIAFSSQPNESLEFVFNAPHQDDYILVIRHMSASESDNLNISFTAKKDEIPNTSSGRFEWYVREFKLSAGQYNLIIENKKGFQVINVVGLIPKKEWEKANMLTEELMSKFPAINTNGGSFVSLSNWYNINYKMVSPGEYNLEVPSSGRWLVFTDTYHSKWNFREDDVSLPPYPFYSAINGFYIQQNNKSGKILFTDQKKIRYAIGFSMFFLVTFTGIFIWNYSKGRRKV